MMRPLVLLPCLPALAALAGCVGAAGPYPSLAPRPIEKTLGEPGVPPTVAPIPDDPEVAARLSAFLGEAQAGDRAFHDDLPAAEEAARKAGAPGSDGWIRAQQALSRAEAGEAQTARALAELNRYATDRANAGALSDADLARLQAATAEVQHLADAEHAQIARLQGALGKP
ncbi:MAG TPA: hypothetical protein VFW19_10345 [Allosphingosinicella sp.]|nr:hypothetical protein [Allosphingosinicella sp.]